VKNLSDLYYVEPLTAEVAIAELTKLLWMPEGLDHKRDHNGGFEPNIIIISY
jgi:hypothetical protein